MLKTSQDLLRALTDPLSAPMFRRPSRIGVESAWYGHVPFGMWIVEQTRPRVLVELGTHNGVSYAAFCDSVQESRLGTSCFAVDTWKGDPHAGFYNENVYAEFRGFHDPRYGAFSRLLRMTFDEAAGQMADCSIDLLHIDGLHSYEAVRHDFETWLPKLTDQAVVLFHDTNVREREFGVWRLWQELCRRYPGFEFVHANGLGVLAVGRNPPCAIAALCALADEPAVIDIRERFALLGERWESEARLIVGQISTARLLADTNRRNAAEWQAAAEARTDLKNQRDAAEASLKRTQEKLETLQAQVKELRHEAEVSRYERDLILNSTLWRLTKPIRRIGDALPIPVRRPLRGTLHAVSAIAHRSRGKPSAQDVATDLPPSSARNIESWRIVFVSGEPDTAGHTYRIADYADAAAATGAMVSRMVPADVPQRTDEFAQADVVVLWRTMMSPDIDAVIRATRSGAAKLVFDVDDLMFQPELAETDLIDGIRSQHLAPDEVADHYSGIRDVLAQADVCTTTTEPLARHARQVGKTTFVLPNGFDRAKHARSRHAVRERRVRTDDGLIRIGYAAGTRTHQRDFAVAAAAIARLLGERPACRLVLFRDPADGRPKLDVLEFPSLAVLADRIEWRDFVPLSELPYELARFDINLVPLEIGNPFCEAKSELKYFEAALAGVCTVASPTEPMTDAIRHGETGMLADTADAWYGVLVALADDADLRQRLGHAAYLDVLWRYGPYRRAELMLSFLAQLAGGYKAARAFELEFKRKTTPNKLPNLAPTEEVFVFDSLGTAEVSVVIPLYNYAGYVTEALESVRAQTIEALDLVVIDDCSTDDSLRVAQAWAEQQAPTGRFNRIMVLRNRTNQGLARTRNVGFDVAETEYVIPLDADNRLLPEFCTRTMRAIRDTHAAFAYTNIQCFGTHNHIIGDETFSPMRLAHSNYIDAMALVAKAAWSAVGGYTHIQHGWEDYDFWCCCVERGIWGIHIPKVLAEYRFHEASMLRTITDTRDYKLTVVQQLEARHSWLSIVDRD
jgi:glycosyltransferase involved in cell wall biosynthesis